jgi:hypothetical protein
MTQDETRLTIVGRFAEWTAIAALRSGRHMKSAVKLRKRLCKVDFKTILCGDSMASEEFDRWHQRNCLILRDCGVRPVGWAAKLLNVHIKTLVYVGGFGRQGLIKCIHPPIDNALIGEVRKECKKRNVTVGPYLARWTCIKDMRRYEDYKALLDELKTLALILDRRSVFELEWFWRQPWGIQGL